MLLRLYRSTQFSSPQLMLPLMVKIILNDHWLHQEADFSQKTDYFTCLFQIFHETTTVSQ